MTNPFDPPARRSPPATAPRRAPVWLGFLCALTVLTLVELIPGALGFPKHIPPVHETAFLAVLSACATFVSALFAERRCNGDRWRPILAFGLVYLAWWLIVHELRLDRFMQMEGAVHVRLWWVAFQHTRSWGAVWQHRLDMLDYIPLVGMVETAEFAIVLLIVARWRARSKRGRIPDPSV